MAAGHCLYSNLWIFQSILQEVSIFTCENKFPIVYCLVKFTSSGSW